MGIEMRIDCKGNHCVAVDGVRGQPSQYSGVSILDKDGIIYVAFTSYYEGCLPVECVYKLKRVGGASFTPVAYNLFRPDDKCPHIGLPDAEKICATDCPQKSNERR